MTTVEKRGLRRFKVALKVTVTDVERTVAVPCVVRDANLSGCQIISANIEDLPDTVLVEIPDFDQPIKGNIVWRDKTTAGVEFTWEAQREDERRGAKRMQVDLPVVVFDADLNEITHCTICDASQTGCRIRGAEIGDLPQNLHLSIPKLTAPIKGEIVWRSIYEAGIKLAWHSDAMAS